MTYPKLEELTDKNTLKELALFLKENYPVEKRKKISMYLRSFRITQFFLSEIYSRIIADVENDQEYWSIRAEVENFKYEDYELSPEEELILKDYSRIKHRLYLDVEDWFLHSHILMEKFGRLAKSIMILIAKTPELRKLAHGLPTWSFNDHINHFVKNKAKRYQDKKYGELLQSCKSWYLKDIKDTRDDLIQHELVGRFWGVSSSPYKFSIKRFLNYMTLAQKIYKIRNTYSQKYPRLIKEKNFFVLLKFFEVENENIEPEDRDRINNIRKDYGKNFPDIPTLYSKMNLFFSEVNDYFIMKSKTNLNKMA